MFKNIKIEQSRIELNPKDFTKKELELIDIKGLCRSFLTIKFDNVSEDTIQAMHSFIQNQYKLPMKYIDCVDFKYVATKYKMSDNDSSYMYIEPLNNNYRNYIRYIPINQSIPLGTNITLDIDETRMSNLKTNFYFIRSNSLQTDTNIEDIIKKANPNSITTKPWLNNVHIGSLDICSKIFIKGRVELMNTDVCNSMTLFGFNRNDDKKYFKIFTYDCYNITPIDIFKLMLKQPNINKQCKELCETVISKCK